MASVVLSVQLTAQARVSSAEAPAPVPCARPLGQTSTKRSPAKTGCSRLELGTGGVVSAGAGISDEGEE
eukprot:4711671-Pyramimonas_sp.AAC.1